MWVVRHGDNLYVRPVKGRDGWYQGARTRHQGRITSGCVTKDVTFADADSDPDLNKALDEAYSTKYVSYPNSIVGHVTNELSPLGDPAAGLSLTSAPCPTSRLAPADDQLRPAVSVLPCGPLP